MYGQALKGHLDMLLLVVLAKDELHGYAIVQELARLSARAFELPEGTIYPALHRLEDQGLVASRWSDDTGRRRRLYALTAAGRRALRKRREEWEGFTSAVRLVLDGAPA